MAFPRLAIPASVTTAAKPHAEDRHLRLACATGAAAVGALHCWLYRNELINLDAVSYIEIARDYARGDLVHALNAYWSPLYSWVLAGAWIIVRPSPAFEYP